MLLKRYKKPIIISEAGIADEDDDIRAQELKKGLQTNNFNDLLDEKYVEGLFYGKKLTMAVENVGIKDIQQLKSLNLSDGEILEINQVVSYFNYANRMVLGLGISTSGDIIGLSPGDSTDPDNWSHG